MVFGILAVPAIKKWVLPPIQKMDFMMTQAPRFIDRAKLKWSPEGHSLLSAWDRAAQWVVINSVAPNGDSIEHVAARLAGGLEHVLSAYVRAVTRGAPFSHAQGDEGKTSAHIIATTGRYARDVVFFVEKGGRFDGPADKYGQTASEVICLHGSPMAMRAAAKGGADYSTPECQAALIKNLAWEAKKWSEGPWEHNLDLNEMVTVYTDLGGTFTAGQELETLKRRLIYAGTAPFTHISRETIELIDSKTVAAASDAAPTAPGGSGSRQVVQQARRHDM